MAAPPNLTTGTYWVDLPCPRCGVLAAVSVHLGSILTTPDDAGASLRLKAKSKPVDHWCGARPMINAPDLSLFEDDEVERGRHPT
ncbi:hypothetical protein [Cellulomonas sp. URHB0016]